MVPLKFFIFFILLFFFQTERKMENLNWLDQILERGWQRQDMLFMGLTLKAMENHLGLMASFLPLMI